MKMVIKQVVIPPRKAGISRNTYKLYHTYEISVIDSQVATPPRKAGISSGVDTTARPPPTLIPPQPELQSRLEKQAFQGK